MICSDEVFSLTQQGIKLKCSISAVYIISTRPMVGKLRLADVNFVALVLNRNNTKKIRITLYKYAISCLKLL